MSDELKGSNGAPADAANGDQGNHAVADAANGDQPTRNSVQYETYRKVVGHNRSLQSRLDELEAKATELEQAKLASEGRKDELIESLKQQLGERDTRLKDVTSTFAYQSVTNQVKAQAAKLGCVDADALTRLMDLSEVEVDNNNFSVNPDQIGALIEQSKQTYPYLFGKPAPKFADGVPNHAQKHDVDISNMSADELQKFYVKKFGNKL